MAGAGNKYKCIVARKLAYMQSLRVSFNSPSIGKAKITKSQHPSFFQPMLLLQRTVCSQFPTCNEKHKARRKSTSDENRTTTIACYGIVAKEEKSGYLNVRHSGPWFVISCCFETVQPKSKNQRSMATLGVQEARDLKQVSERVKLLRRLRRPNEYRNVEMHKGS